MTTQNPTASVSSPTNEQIVSALLRQARVIDRLRIQISPGLDSPQWTENHTRTLLDLPRLATPESVPANPQQSGGDWRKALEMIGDERRTTGATIEGLRSIAREALGQPGLSGECNGNQSGGVTEMVQPKADPDPVVQPDNACVTCGHYRLSHKGSPGCGTTACSQLGCPCSEFRSAPKPTPSPAPEKRVVYLRLKGRTAANKSFWKREGDTLTYYDSGGTAFSSLQVNYGPHITPDQYEEFFPDSPSPSESRTGEDIRRYDMRVTYIINVPCVTSHAVCDGAWVNYHDVSPIIQRLTRERDQWKANHDNQVELKRQLLDRPDLKDRAESIQRLTRERDELKKYEKSYIFAQQAFGGYYRYCNSKEANDILGTVFHALQIPKPD